MQVLLAVVLVGLTQGTSIVSRLPCNSNRLLTYEYRVVAYNGIPGTSENVSGVQMNMTFSVTSFPESNQFQLRIHKCASAPLQATSIKDTEVCNRLIEWVLPFDMKNDQVTAIYPEPREEEHILNLKRGIISAFQVSPKGENNVQVVDEVDVLGTCTTEITESHAEEEIEILKRRETEKCEGRPKHTIMVQSQTQEAKFAYGIMTAVYRLNSMGDIKLAELIQVEELAPLTKEAGHVVTHINQTFWLVNDECDRSVSVINVNGRDNRQLSFNYSISSPEPLSTKLDARSLIEQITTADPKAVPHMFLQLISAMREMRLKELRELRTNVQNNDKQFSVFLDTLPFVFTNAATDLIVELARPKSNLIKTRKTALALSLAAAPIQFANPCRLLELTLELAEKLDSRESTLTLGTVINRVHESHPYTCQVHIDKALQYLIHEAETALHKLPFDYNPSEFPRQFKYRAHWERALHVIKALGNAGIPTTISLLEKYVNTKTLLIEGRVAAINALQRIGRNSPLRVRELALRLYLARWNENEIRTAAFAIFMEVVRRDFVQSHQMRQALMQVSRESDNSEVLSYVCSFLKTLQHTRDPSFRNLRSSVFYHGKWTNAFAKCRSASHSFFSSHYLHYYKSMGDMLNPLPRDAMGASLSLDYVSTSASRIPRFARSKIRAHLFGYDMDIMEAGVRATGIEKLLCTVLLGSEGYLRLGSFAKDAYDHLCGTHDENTSISVYLKAMGDEVLWNNFRPHTNLSKIDTTRNRIIDFFTKDRPFRREFQSIVNYFFNSGSYLLHSNSVYFNHTAGFLDIRRVIPTIVGMPINLTVAAAGHIRFNLSTYATYHNDHPVLAMIPARWRKWLPKMFNQEEKDFVEGYINIHPKIIMATTVQVLLDDYEYKPQLNFSAECSSMFHQNVSAVIYGNHSTFITIHEMPETETVIFNASYSQSAVVNGKSQELQTDRTDKDTIHIKSYDLIGLDMFVNFSSADRSDRPIAPMLPPAGPATMSLSLKRPNANMSKIVFSFTTSGFKLGNVSTSASLDAVGAGRSINGSLRWSLANRRFIINGSLNSALANSSTVVIVNASSQLSIDSYANFNSSLANFTVGFGLNTTHINANSSLVIGKHRIYQAALRGSRRQFYNGNLSFYLFIGDKQIPHTYDMTVNLSKWRANITGQLLLSGESEPHTVIVGGSFGKYYLNMTGLFKSASECELYQMGFNGSYEQGNIGSHFMIDLPHILNRRDVYLNGSVGLVFAYLSAAIYQMDQEKPDKININAHINSKIYAIMNGSLILADDNQAHWSINTTLNKWSVESNTHLQVMNKSDSNMRVSVNYRRNRVSGLAQINVPNLFTNYSNGFSNINDVTWFFQKISHILHQQNLSREYNITVKGELDKWYSNVSMYVYRARNEHHYLNFNGSFAKWYINGTALLRPVNYTKPHLVHLSGDIGKYFLNGSVVFNKGCNRSDLRTCEGPYRFHVNGSVGKVFVNATASCQLPSDVRPHNATLWANVGKWYMNLSATTELNLNSEIWGKHHYVRSNVSLNGRAIQWSANSSLLEIPNVRKFLRMHSIYRLETSTNEQPIPSSRETEENRCQIVKGFVQHEYLQKKCRGAIEEQMCSSGCETLYSTYTRLILAKCIKQDDGEEKYDNASPTLLEVPVFLGCKRQV